jgi:hypothetical protein
VTLIVMAVEACALSRNDDDGFQFNQKIGMGQDGNADESACRRLLQIDEPVSN